MGWRGRYLTSAQRRMVDWHGQWTYRFRAAAELPVLAHPLKVYTTSDGLAAPQVYRLFEDSRGDIWVGFSSGVARFRQGSFSVFAAEQGSQDQSQFQEMA